MRPTQHMLLAREVAARAMQENDTALAKRLAEALRIQRGLTNEKIHRLFRLWTKATPEQVEALLETNP